METIRRFFIQLFQVHLVSTLPPKSVLWAETLVIQNESEIDTLTKDKVAWLLNPKVAIFQCSRNEDTVGTY